MFKKKAPKGLPPISTASLPDIVFMLLFFFMVTTTMRNAELKVKTSTPTATEIEKLAKKSLVSYIYVGPPIESLQATFGTAPRIQLNDKFARKEEIPAWVEAQKQDMAEMDRAKLTVSLKADKTCKMGIITDVKQQLRIANALKLNYSTKAGQGSTIADAGEGE